MSETRIKIIEAASASTLNRHEIPSLQKRGQSDFAPVIVSRSYAFGRSEPMRVCRGEALIVWVRVNSIYANSCKMRFFSTIDDGVDDQPYFEPCEKLDDGMFLCFLVPSRSGTYVFRASYSLDGGKSWTFDDAPYSWLIVDPPTLNDIRMYTLIPNASEHFGNWKAELDRIKELGCNMVHLLPITLMDESESPYSAHDLFTIDHSYLDPNDPRDGLAQWEDFVEHAKSLGIRLCIDLVLNHVGIKSRIVNHKPEWIVPDPSRPDGFKRAGCWAGSSWLTWEDILLLNYAGKDEETRHELWSYMASYTMFWANYAAYTDGMVRFDNLHSSNPEFISSLMRAMRIKYPDLILLAEFFADEDTLVQRTVEWDIDLLLATPWEYKFVPELRRYFTQLHRLSEQVRFLVPVSSHDSGSLVQEFWTVEATFPRYATSALLSFGATGLSQGIEWGLEQKIHFIGRNRRISRGESERLSGFIQRINQILKDNRAFQLTKNCHFVDDNHSAIIAAVRTEALRPHECFVVAANFDVTAPHAVTVNLEPFVTGDGNLTVEELVSRGELRAVHGCTLTIQLGPCEVQVLHCRRARSNGAAK